MLSLVAISQVFAEPHIFSFAQQLQLSTRILVWGRREGLFPEVFLRNETRQNRPRSIAILDEFSLPYKKQFVILALTILELGGGGHGPSPYNQYQIPNVSLLGKHVGFSPHKASNALNGSNPVRINHGITRSRNEIGNI